MGLSSSVCLATLFDALRFLHRLLQPREITTDLGAAIQHCIKRIDLIGGTGHLRESPQRHWLRELVAMFQIATQ